MKEVQHVRVGGVVVVCKVIIIEVVLSLCWTIYYAGLAHVILELNNLGGPDTCRNFILHVATT